MSKKLKKLYNEQGRWVEERGRIKGAIRRTFRLSPQMKEVMQAARVELSPALKKDGTPGKRPRVRYRCNYCEKLWSQKNVNVDHIKTVVPLWQEESTMSYDEIVRGVFCDKSNLQVLCSIAMIRNGGKPSCHNIKTNEENYIRRRWAKEKNGSHDHRICANSDWIDMESTEHGWLIECREEKKLKEEKKNARRQRKSRKRKENSSTD